MLLFAQISNPAIFFTILSIGVLGFLVSGGLLAYRLYEGLSILPRYEPRRPVPWDGWDLLLIVLLYLILLFSFQRVAFFAGKATAKPEAGQQQDAKQPIRQGKTDKEKTTAAHPLAQLLKDKSPTIFCVCFVVGVVIVPIFEEFIFRLFFTGWLLSVERSCRRKWPDYFKSRGILPIHLTSAVFAFMHFRAESPEIEEADILRSMSIQAAASLVSLLFAVIWMIFLRGASARDLGWEGRKWAKDLSTGVWAFFSTALPIYALQIGLGVLLPKEIAPDPIVLYFFAIVLGTLYFRTSRILPSIVMHMLLNAGSLGLAWSMM